MRGGDILPRMTPYEIAQSHLGLKEIPGAEDNPEIVQMFADVGHSWVKDDETAWCAAFVGSCLERGGIPSTRKLNARSYMEWGTAVPLSEAAPGDIAVFWRGSRDSWKGHVAFLQSYHDAVINVLGGNQHNQVSIDGYPQLRLLGIRRAP